METYGITWLILCCISLAAKIFALITVDYPVTAVHHARQALLETVILAGIVVWGINIFV